MDSLMDWSGQIDKSVKQLVFMVLVLHLEPLLRWKYCCEGWVQHHWWDTDVSSSACWCETCFFFAAHPQTAGTNPSVCDGTVWTSSSFVRQKIIWNQQMSVKEKVNQGGKELRQNVKMHSASDLFLLMLFAGSFQTYISNIMMPLRTIFPSVWKIQRWSSCALRLTQISPNWFSFSGFYKVNLCIYPFP